MSLKKGKWENVGWTIDKLIERLEYDRDEYGGDTKVLLADKDFIHAFDDFGTYKRKLESGEFLVILPLGRPQFRGLM